MSKSTTKTQLTVYPFTDKDWGMYSGCETDNPYKAEVVTDKGIMEIVFDEQIEIHLNLDEYNIESYIIKESAFHIQAVLQDEMSADIFFAQFDQFNKIKLID